MIAETEEMVAWRARRGDRTILGRIGSCIKGKHRCEISILDGREVMDAK